MEHFANTLFLNSNIRKIGFGLAGDLRMLSKANLPGLDKLGERSKSVLNLDKARGRLASLLSLPTTTERGLSGFCHIVLGKPLCKVDQISDWSRRPLRPSQVCETFYVHLDFVQVRYAALDAVVCLDIYEALFQRAEELGKSSELNLLLEDFLYTKSRDAMEETSKSKKSRRSASAKNATASVPPFPAPTTPYFETPTLPSNLQLVLDNMLQVMPL